MGPGASPGGGASTGRMPSATTPTPDSRGWGALPPPPVYQALVKIELRMGGWSRKGNNPS